MRLFTLGIFLVTSCASLPTGIDEGATSNYYVYRQNKSKESTLSPIFSGIAPLALFKRASVGVEQGLLGFSLQQLSLIKEACSYINNTLNEDFLSYKKSDPDITIRPEEFNCCLGEVTSEVKSKRLIAIIKIKTVQSNEQFYTTMVHEFGHVLGLAHTEATGSVMSGSSEESPTSSFNELEVKTLQYLRRKL